MLRCFYPTIPAQALKGDKDVNCRWNHERSPGHRFYAFPWGKRASNLPHFKRLRAPDPNIAHSVDRLIS
jgi:hypothetical protein